MRILNSNIKKKFFNNYCLNSLVFRSVDSYQPIILNHDPVAPTWKSFKFYKNVIFNIQDSAVWFGRGGKVYYPTSVARALLETISRKKKKLYSHVKIIKSFKSFEKKWILMKEEQLSYFFSGVFIKKPNSSVVTTFSGFEGCSVTNDGKLVVDYNSVGVIMTAFCNVTKNLMISKNLIANFLLLYFMLFLKIMFSKNSFLLSMKSLKNTARCLRKKLLRDFIYFEKLNFVFMGACISSKGLFNSVASISLSNFKLSVIENSGHTFYKNLNFKNYLVWINFNNFVQKKKNYRFFRLCYAKLNLKRSTISLLSYKFLRRLNHLLTKRGGRSRAFHHISLLLHFLTPQRYCGYKSKSGFKRTMHLFPLLRVLFALKSYFFLKKRTKGRKTVYVPCILPKKKRIKLAARWFNVLLKQRTSRPLYEMLLFAVLDIVTNKSSPARLIKKNLNKQVLINKVNLTTRKRRQKKPKKKKKPRVVTTTKKNLIRQKKKPLFNITKLRKFGILRAAKKYKRILLYLQRLWYKKRRWKRYKKSNKYAKTVKLIAKKTLY